MHFYFYFQGEWEDFLGGVEIDCNENVGELVGVGVKVPGEVRVTGVGVEEPEAAVGGEVSVGDLLAKSPHPLTLLVLNRHFAWLPWRIHVAQLAQRQVSNGLCTHTHTQS